MGELGIPASLPLLVFLGVVFGFAGVYLRRTRDPLAERVQAALRGQVSLRDRAALWGRSMSQTPVIARYFGYAAAERRLKTAGFPFNLTADEFLAVKLGLLGVAALVFLTSLATGKLLLAVLGLAVFLPDLILGQMIAARKKAMDREFVLSAGRLAAAARAGKSLAESVRWTAAKAGSVLGGELGWCLSRLEAGLPLESSLDALASDTGLLSIRRLATALINAQKYGTGIAEALVTAAKDARKRRMDDAVARLAERKGWATLALVLMILPGIILILVPMLIQLKGVGLF